MAESPDPPRVPRRTIPTNDEDSQVVVKTSKNDPPGALRALVKYYDEEGQFSPEKMDPQTGGLFEEEFIALLDSDAEGVIEALVSSGFIVVRSRPRLQNVLTVWPTGKGLVEGRKKDSPSSREAAAQATSEQSNR